MSKKAKIYLLIIINLIAWGYVGYRIYAALQGDNDIEFDTTKTAINKIEETKKEDTIVLSFNYLDPFLKGGNYSKEHKIHSSSNNHIGLSQKAEKPGIKKPLPIIVVPTIIDIKYVGLVNNNDKGTQTAMISINGKSYFVKQKDVIEGYTCLEITNGFIKLKKGKEVLIINK